MTMNSTIEPYAPPAPGHHRAQSTAFTVSLVPEIDTNDTLDDPIPLFISNTDGNTDGKYVYFGYFVQNRWFDRLGYDKMIEKVPRAVKQYWAKKLS